MLHIEVVILGKVADFDVLWTEEDTIVLRASKILRPIAGTITVPNRIIKINANPIAIANALNFADISNLPLSLEGVR